MCVWLKQTIILSYETVIKNVKLSINLYFKWQDALIKTLLKISWRMNFMLIVQNIAYLFTVFYSQ